MDKPWEQLYHLQDEVLGEIREVRRGLYLTGGTALSRGYYQHRDSDDLDFLSPKTWRISSGCAVATSLTRSPQSSRPEGKPPVSFHP